MKKVLFAGLLVLAGVSVSAQNLIKNEKFATEVKTKVTNANKATAGEWFIMNNEADGVTTIAWEETGDAKYPNAMKLDNSGAEKNLSWYKAFDNVLPMVWTKVSMFLLSMQKLKKQELRSAYTSSRPMRKRMIMVSTILLSSCVETMTRMLNRMLRVHNTILKLKRPVNGLK